MEAGHMGSGEMERLGMGDWERGATCVAGVQSALAKCVESRERGREVKGEEKILTLNSITL